MTSGRRSSPLLVPGRDATLPRSRSSRPVDTLSGVERAPNAVGGREIVRGARKKVRRRQRRVVGDRPPGPSSDVERGVCPLQLQMARVRHRRRHRDRPRSTRGSRRSGLAVRSRRPWAAHGFDVFGSKERPRRTARTLPRGARLDRVSGTLARSREASRESPWVWSAYEWDDGRVFLAYLIRGADRGTLGQSCRC